MAQKTVNSADHFYQHLDQETLGRSPFSCAHLLILMLVIFVGLYGLAWHVTRNIHWYSLGSQKERFEKSAKEFLKRVQEDIAHSSPGGVTISISQEEFNEIVKNVELVEGSRLRNIKIDLIPGKLVLSGLYTNILAIPITLWYSPKVSHETIDWELTRAKVAQIPLPNYAIRELDRMIQPTLKTVSRPFRGLPIKNITINDEEMVVTGGST